MSLNHLAILAFLVINTLILILINWLKPEIFGQRVNKYTPKVALISRITIINLPHLVEQDSIVIEAADQKIIEAALATGAWIDIADYDATRIYKDLSVIWPPVSDNQRIPNIKVGEEIAKTVNAELAKNLSRKEVSSLLTRHRVELN